MLDGILAKEGESRATLGRERYLERMRAFVATTRDVMLGQQRRVGASVDWGRLRFTMDEGSAKAVRVAFERLYGDGLAYRTEALVNWCPGCRTSVSDLEVIGTPETGTLWSVRYHLVDRRPASRSPDETITVATTRPETILGDTAVAVHPDDPRYAALVGRQVLIPFVERDVPIIADEVVDPRVRHRRGQDHAGPRPRRPRRPACATACRRRRHDRRRDDRRDRHALRRADRYEAREAIVADLEARGDLVGDGPHEMVIGRCQRSDDIVEPRLKTQWFIARPAARGERARGDPRRAGRGSCPSDSRRPGSTG